MELPIREYRCGDCGFQFESIELGSEEKQKREKRICPNCGSDDVGKRISLFSSSIGEASSNNKPAPRRFG